MYSILLLGRIFFSAIFIMASPKHFSHEFIELAAGRGVPMPEFLVPFSGLLSMLGGFSILVGYKARWGAWLLIIFLIPVTIMMHRFWYLADPAEINVQQGMFMKNLSIMGGALFIAYFGAGPLSVDED